MRNLSQTQHKSKQTEFIFAKITTLTTSLVRDDVDGNYYCDCSNEASLQFESHKMTCWRALHCAFLFVRLHIAYCLCGSIIRRSGNSQSWSTVSGYLIQRITLCWAYGYMIMCMYWAFLHIVPCCIWLHVRAHSLRISVRGYTIQRAHCALQSTQPQWIINWSLSPPRLTSYHYVWQARVTAHVREYSELLQKLLKT